MKTQESERTISARTGQRTAKAVIYMRVARASQLKSGEPAIRRQRSVCRSRADELGATVVDEFIDCGAAGTTNDRPALSALLERLRAGDVEHVIAEDRSRLSRTRLNELKIRLIVQQLGAAISFGTEPQDRMATTIRHALWVAGGCIGENPKGPTPGPQKEDRQ